MNGVAVSPSIDWSTEFLHSIAWMLKAFGVTAVCVLVVVVIIGRGTEWGRQFWRITGAYFVGRNSVRVWLVLAALLLSTAAAVRINVLLSYYANDLFSSLQLAFQGIGSADPTMKDTGQQGFWEAMLIFAILATVFVARFFLDLYLTQRFIISWRVWLTRRLVDDWLDGHAYFRGQFAREPVDNPDQRIQADIDIVTTSSREPNNPGFGSSHILLFGAVESMLTVASFGVILWQLSGPLTVGGVTVPRALFWIVIGYVAVATLVAFWIGRPLIRLSFLNELRNASFRYAMIRVKDAAGAVGLYRGEDAERHELTLRLGSVIANYRDWLNRMVMFLGWNTSMSQAINPLPYIVQAQRLFAQQITFGDVMQSATAFHAIHDGMSFFRNAYDEFAGYRAALIRLDGLLEANTRARALPVLPRAEESDGAVRLRDVDVRTPDGRHLIDKLNLVLPPGDTLVITGRSGSGKTVLMESLAGLWPYAGGSIGYPCADRATMFLPQQPYIPLGALRTVVSYPRRDGTFTDDDIQRVLLKVALPHLLIRVADSHDWAKTLSPGEQQRIAFARILLNRPDVVFLDESTSALDEGLELMLYQLLRSELPNTTLVSVSHRRTVEQFHDHQLELLGDGDWAVRQLTEAGDHP